MVNIGMIFQKADGSSLAPADLAPLMVPTSDVLKHIVQQTVIEVRKETLTGAIQALQLVKLSERVVLHGRALVESSKDSSISRLLADFRVAEYQALIWRFEIGTRQRCEAICGRSSYCSCCENYHDDSEWCYGVRGWWL